MGGGRQRFFFWGGGGGTSQKTLCVFQTNLLLHKTAGMFFFRCRKRCKGKRAVPCSFLFFDKLDAETEKVTRCTGEETNRFREDSTGGRHKKR